MSTSTSKSDNTTDSWIIIASVQTSRSVSGARYLPAGIVEQEEKTTLISDINREKKLNEPVEERPEENLTTVAQSTKPRTSTESLLDKLDRVQSDLSNKLLILNNNGNNYILTQGKEEEEAVLEGMSFLNVKFVFFCRWKIFYGHHVHKAFCIHYFIYAYNGLYGLAFYGLLSLGTNTTLVTRTNNFFWDISLLRALPI